MKILLIYEKDKNNNIRLILLDQIDEILSLSLVRIFDN